MASTVAAWPTVALGEVLRQVARPEMVQADKEYRLLGIRLDGNGPFLRETKMGSQVSATALSQVKAGDFIYSRLFAWHGAFGTIDDAYDGCYVSGEFPTFRPEPSQLDIEFLRYWFRLPTTLAAVEANCAGSTPLTRNRFKEQFFLALAIPLPPLDEQRRIVGRIEALAGRIAEARGLRQAAMGRGAQFMRSAIAYALDLFAGEADIVTVESVAHSVTDGDHQPPPKAESGVPFLFISHIVRGHVDMTGCKWVTPEYFSALSPMRTPELGDVLYTAVGSYGIPCLVDTDEPFCFQRHIAIIKPDRSRVVPQYLTWALSSSDVFEQATAWATGSAQLTVPLSAIRKLRFSLPEISVQRRIVAYLDCLSSGIELLNARQSEAASELDALLPSVLDRAFQGEL